MTKGSRNLSCCTPGWIAEYVDHLIHNTDNCTGNIYIQVLFNTGLGVKVLVYMSTVHAESMELWSYAR